MNTMNRCTPISDSRLTMTLVVAWLFAILNLTCNAQAQGVVRQFPPAALRGVLVVIAPPDITLNGKPAKLSPGARIKGPNNLQVLSGSLVGSSLVVNYLPDTQGLIHEVWILSAAEAQEKRAGQDTIRNFVFGSDVNKTESSGASQQ
jgi:hypothetical protein